MKEFWDNFENEIDQTKIKIIDYKNSTQDQGIHKVW